MEPGAPLVCVSEALRAEGNHLGGSPSNSHVQGRAIRTQAPTGEDTLRLHLEECLCLASEACGMVS